MTPSITTDLLAERARADGRGGHAADDIFDLRGDVEGHQAVGF